VKHLCYFSGFKVLTMTKSEKEADKEKEKEKEKDTEPGETPDKKDKKRRDVLYGKGGAS